MTNSELKSKVMTLGNKLAPRMGNRRRGIEDFLSPYAPDVSGFLHAVANMA